MAWYMNMAIASTLIALSLLVLVVLNQNWIKIQTLTDNYFSGIWKVCTKIACSSIIARDGHFRTIQALVVIALFCAFIGASFMMFTYRYVPKLKIPRFLVASMCCFITGFLIFLGMSIFSIRLVLQGVHSKAKVYYLWNFYLAWCTCPLFFISGMVNLMAYFLTPIRRLSLTDEENLSQSTILDLRTSSSSCPDENSRTQINTT